MATVARCSLERQSANEYVGTESGPQLFSFTPPEPCTARSTVFAPGGRHSSAATSTSPPVRLATVYVTCLGAELSADDVGASMTQSAVRTTKIVNRRFIPLPACNDRPVRLPPRALGSVSMRANDTVGTWRSTMSR